MRHVPAWSDFSWNLLLAETVDAAIGEAVLDLAVAGAETAFGLRLEAAYALGSLAHDGFSSLVSDVDLGLILSDPLTAHLYPGEGDRGPPR